MKTDWIRPSPDASTQIWGFRSGIQVGIWPADIEGKGEGGPRGLFRVGYPILDGSKSPGLVNFVAVEPVVNSQRCLSELEHSDLSNKQGKLFWTGSKDSSSAKPDSGIIELTETAESLSVTIYIEPFLNGASPIVRLTFHSANPNEVQFSITTAPRGSVMERCVLTATMGNYMRLRRLYLRDHIVQPRDLWPKYNEKAFTDDAFFDENLLPTNASGDLIVCAATDEHDPHSQPADPVAPWWQYRGSFPLTQYWRKPKGSWSNKIRARVNGRCVYWAGDRPIPGGMAFENFDLVEPYAEGQTFIFGLTKLTPEELLHNVNPR